VWCREWTLVKDLSVLRRAKPLPCRSWSCDFCAPGRTRKLVAQLMAGEPNRFLTLTVNPAFGDSPEDRRKLLAEAVALLIKRLRRDPRWADLQYGGVIERTAKGEPHFHMLIRSASIPQPLISAIMSELIHAPIVDIRKVGDRRKTATYLAKYVAKAPARFEGFKRYWFSRAYDLSDWLPEADEGGFVAPWKLVKANLASVINLWMDEGWTGRRDGEDAMLFMPVQNWNLFYGGP